MPILFSVISRGQTILVQHASVAGNFGEVTEQILSKVPLDDMKLTYSHRNFLFHVVSQNGIIYLCITDDEFERARAFSFLSEIRGRFDGTYGQRAKSAIPYAMNGEFAPVLANEMKRFSEKKQGDPITHMQGELDELKEIMVKNIESIAARGERMELLIDKTDNLSSSATQFRGTSRNLARTMWWKNVKMMVFLVLGVVLALYLLISIGCGGLAWQKCVG